MSTFNHRLQPVENWGCLLTVLQMKQWTMIVTKVPQRAMQVIPKTKVCQPWPEYGESESQRVLLQYDVILQTSRGLAERRT